MTTLSRVFHSLSVVPQRGPTTPTMPKQRWFGLFPVRSPLLGESRLISFPGVTEMVQFTPFTSNSLWIQEWIHAHDGVGVSPFGDPRIEACLAAPRGLSQLSTSFFVSRRQGIHRTPLVTFQPLRSCSVDRSLGLFWSV